MDPLSYCAIVGWLALHLGALTLAWATRVSVGSRMEAATQLVFFSVMAGLGAAAWVGRQTDIELWPVPAVTLMAMVVTAVVDFRRLGESVHRPSPAAGR